jgi:hypothetical protein
MGVGGHRAEVAPIAASGHAGRSSPPSLSRSRHRDGYDMRKCASPVQRRWRCDDREMERNPLWIGEVGIVRAIFGHAAHANPDRLRRIAPQASIGRVVQVRLEERIGRRRLDVLATFNDGSGRADQYLVVEAKVGAVIDPDTLAEYLTKVQAAYGPAEGLLVAAYEPVGELPSGWVWRDLEDVAGLLSCRTDTGILACQVCQEISYAVALSAASKTVTEWRALAQAARHADVPGEWVTKGGGSSVGRPLVYFQSWWLDADEDSYVQVEVGNNYDLPTASVMVVAQAPTPADKIVFSDRLWRALAAGATAAPPLPEGITDASVRGRGARGQAGVDAQRNGVPAAWSRGFDQSGWHARGRTLRHVNGDYAALLPAALEQGVALFEAASVVLQGDG